MPPMVIPMLPCADIDEIAEFLTALGFTVTYKQTRPNPFVALEGHGFPIQYYGLDGHLAEQSHSTCGVLVADTGAMFETFAAGLRARYGKLPVSGYPRITRPRPRKNAGGVSGFSLIDPAGNWIRFFRDGPPDPIGESSPLREGLLNAIVLADSKGDPVQAAKILRGAMRRADPSDPAVSEAARLPRGVGREDLAGGRFLTRLQTGRHLPLLGGAALPDRSETLSHVPGTEKRT